jgi:hypothetical protein
MADSTTNPLSYYAFPGLMTDPGEHAGMLKGLPAEIPALCRIVQNNLIHIFWGEAYGQTFSDERKAEVQIRRASTMLGRIKAVDDRLLTIPRPAEKRLVGNCRDFSVMLVTLLRHQGIPARARCGFGAYFTPATYEDHWVAEYWNHDEERWVLVDAQLDEVQSKTLDIAFDTCDVPRDQFITGGQAWQMARSGESHPDQFGIFEMHGLWFIRGNVIRDLASLNKAELLPWDSWGVMDSPDADSAENMALLDQIAELSAVGGNDRFTEIRTRYNSDERLRLPQMIRSYTNGPEPQIVDVLSGEEFAVPVPQGS